MTTIDYLKCLADETRLRCLHLLILSDELCVCELTEVMQLSQPKISRHLAQLRQAEIVRDRRKGQWIYYQINPDIAEWIQQLLDQALKSFSNEDIAHSDRRKLNILLKQGINSCL